MLFNSYSFLFVFLPITLLGYFSFGRVSRRLGATWLAGASLFFYAWWDYRYIALLLVSICANYTAGSYISKHAGEQRGRRILVVAIAINLMLLGYYKYADFFVVSANSIAGTTWPVLGIILPIGISFFTFTQIAFLADAYAGKVKETEFVNYLLFVTYFPHLIAGPVLHHKEMMPQFALDRNYKPLAENFGVGLSFFVLGLAKKVLIADNLAGYASPIFDTNAASPSLFAAWGGSLAYTLQLYFDFSGYSDMAVGLARMFGVRLPLNFNSPYKARSIAEFWRRWHMTLSRFLKDYLYIPLGGNRHGPTRRQLNLATTMILGGLWHGAGWNFVIWGALHGLFLVVHQGWQGLCRYIPFTLPRKLTHILAVLVTFLCVVFAWVYFRAPDLATANRVVTGMLGGFGGALPEPILARLGFFRPLLEGMGIQSYLGGGAVFVETWAWVAAGSVIAFFAPNTQEIVAHFESASADSHHQPRALTSLHAVSLGMLLGVAILALSRPTEFLYFQF